MASDSYLQLLTSIEKQLRADLPAGSGEELSSSIERALFEEARVGELALSSWRLAIIGVILAAVVTLGVLGRLGLSTSALVVGISVAWGAAAVVMEAALRRGWYRLWLRYVAPAGDALMIVSLCGALALGNRDGTGAPAGGVLGFVAALCAFLAVSGAPRLSISSARLSSALAAAIFLVVGLLIRADVAVVVSVAAILAVIGLLSTRTPALVRRVVVHELGRMEMTRKYEEARQAVDAREQVLKIVSHDLRNPLHTVAMSVQLLLDGAGTEEQRRKQLAIIKRAGERMNGLVRDLLDVAKLEAGRLAIQPRPVDAAPIIAEAEEMLRPLTTDKSLRLETDVPGNLPRVNIDAGRIVQVLSNLVGNAVKFTPAGGRITIRAQTTGGSLRISVADTGPGIPAEQLPHIFGRFWQADPTDRRGIGLGLAISKGIIEAHGGRIWVESRVGEGTTFHFSIPSTSGGSQSAQRVASTNAASSASRAEHPSVP